MNCIMINLNKINRVILLIGFMLFFVPCLKAQKIYTVDQVPSPKAAGQDYYVSNPDHILDEATVAILDSISLDIDKTTGSEYAIVIVDDFEGDDDFQFAYDLFNKWGIGKSETNNGLLLFIAKNKRMYRFISGYGMESIFPDAYLKRVGEKFLVPNFKNEDYDRGVLEASEFIAQILKSPDSIKELERMMPEAMPFFSWKNPILKNTLLVVGFFLALYVYIHLIGKKLKSPKKKLRPIAPIFFGLGCMLLLMFITLFIFAFLFNNLEKVYQLKNLPYFAFVLGGLILSAKIFDTQEVINKSYVDEKDKELALKKFSAYAIIPSIIAPLSLFGLGWIFNKTIKNKKRFTPPDQSGEWERIKRTSNKKETSSYLDQGNIKEEKVGARKYEIWRNTKTNKIQLIPWDIKKRFTECPECHYMTLEKINKTVKNPTYTATGTGETIEKCLNCSYRNVIDIFTIPKKTKSSSGGSGSSSGGSSGGGGGSFGGGSSGGGGAGGRW